MISQELILLIRETFQLNWKGVHGVSHWARVRINGLLMAQKNGANQRVVELFAFLHDIKREADFNDPLHGERAARFIATLPDDLLGIDYKDKQILMQACHDHSKGFVEADLTIGTCWDADRLDLGRGGQRPDTRKLCTEIAKQPGFYEQAYLRAIYQHRKQRNIATVQKWKPVL